LSIIILKSLLSLRRGFPVRGFQAKGNLKNGLFPLFIRLRKTNRGGPGRRYPAGGSAE
jgi:hypothetical protein